MDNLNQDSARVLKNWPNGTFSHVVLWEDVYPFKVKNEEFRLIAKDVASCVGERASKVNPKDVAIHFVIYPTQHGDPDEVLLEEAQKQWPGVADRDDMYTKERINFVLPGGIKYNGFVFWKSDPLLIYGMEDCSIERNSYLVHFTDGSSVDLIAKAMCFEPERYCFYDCEAPSIANPKHPKVNYGFSTFYSIHYVSDIVRMTISIPPQPPKVTAVKTEYVLSYIKAMNDRKNKK